MSELVPPQMAAVAARLPHGAGGLEIRPGWYDLVVRLDAQLAALSPSYRLAQCKSKYGTLRYHAEPGDDDTGDDTRLAFSDAIWEAEGESARLCEECGDGGAQVVRGGWVWTLCAKHSYSS